ncbi:MAG: GUN4 domain-containing protein [Cyanobacteria bacterium P01_A01_bin.40]
MSFKEYFDNLSTHEKENILLTQCKLLAKKGNFQRLAEFLTNFIFISETINRFDIETAIDHYHWLNVNWITENPEYVQKNTNCLKLIKKVLQQSSNLLKEDPNQLPGLLISNLSNVDNNLIEKLLNQAKAYREKTWLLPVNIEKKNIDQPLEMAFPSEHQGYIKALDISDDGQWGASSSRETTYLNKISGNNDDNTFKVWNLNERKLESKLVNDPIEINVGREVYNDFDRYIQVPVDLLAISHDARWGVSAGQLERVDINDLVIDVWDLRSQQSVKRLIVERENISSLDIVAVDIFDPSIDHPDNEPEIDLEVRVIASFDEYAKIWILSIGEETDDDELNYTVPDCNLINHLFKGEGYLYQNKVALSPCGNIAVMVTQKILSYWNLVEGCLEYSVPINLPENARVKIVKVSSSGKVSIIFSNKELEIYDFPLFKYDKPCPIDGGIDRLIHNNQEYPYQEYPYQLFLLKNFVSLAPKQISYLLSSNNRRKLFSWIAIKTFNIISMIATKFSGSRSFLTKSDFNRITSLSLTYKEIYSQKISLKLENLDIPSCVTNDLKTGLIDTKRNDIQIVNLGDAIQGKTNPTPDVNPAPLSPPWIDAVAISLDGRHVIEKIDEKSYILWDALHRQKQKLRISEKQSFKKIKLFAQSLDKKWILAISNSNKLMEWDTQASQPSELFNLSYLFKAISPNGRWSLMQSYSRTLHLQELQTGNIIASLYDYYGIINTLEFHVELSSEEFENYTGKSLKEWGFLDYSKDRAYISDDGKFVAIYTRNYSGRKWIWDSKGWGLAIWDTEHNCISKLALPFPDVDETSMCINGSTLVVGKQDSRIFVADIKHKKPIALIVAHKKDVTSINIEANNKLFVSSSLDQTIKVFSIESGEYIAGYTFELPIIDSKIYSAEDGTTYVTVIDEESKIHIFKLIDSGVNSSNLLETYTDFGNESFPAREFNLPTQFDIYTWRDDELESFVESEITLIHSLVNELKNQDFPSADLTTKEIIENFLEEKGNVLDTENEDYIFERLLFGIDQLWLNYSNKQYSFSVQIEILSHLSYFHIFKDVIGRSRIFNNKNVNHRKKKKGYFPWAIGKDNISLYLSLIGKIALLHNKTFSYKDVSGRVINIKKPDNNTLQSKGNKYSDKSLRDEEHHRNKLQYLFEQAYSNSKSEEKSTSAKEVKTLYTYAIPGCYFQIRYEILIPGELILLLHGNKKRVSPTKFLISDEYQCPLITFKIPKELLAIKELKGSLVFNPSDKSKESFAIDLQINFPTYFQDLGRLFNKNTNITSYRFVSQLIDILGTENHPYVLQILANLAAFYEKQGTEEEAVLIRNKCKIIESERNAFFPFKNKSNVCLYILSPESIA